MKILKLPKIWIGGALLLLVLGHWLYWYRPRVRTASPDLEGLPAQVLLDAGFPTAVWIPYPHQNLGSLQRLGTSPQDLAVAVATLAGVDAPVLPQFGPFSAPPAKELVLAADPEEGRFFLAARIYPGMAVFARLAGRMARNPWLGGGDIELRDGTVEIRWQGTLWSARKVGEADTGAGGRDDSPMGIPDGLSRPALTLARTDGRLSFLPGGWYRLAAHGDERHFDRLPAGGGAGDSGVVPGKVEEPFLVPLLSESVTLVAAQDRPPDGRRGLGLFTSEAGGDNTGFALFSAGPARKLPLTGLGLAVLLGDRGYSGIASGWSLLATSELSFRQGAYLVSPVREGLEAHQAAGQPLELAVVGRPQAALSVLDELTERLAALGPAAHGERLRLLALKDLVAPLRDYDQIRLLVTADRQRVHLELKPPAGE